MRSGTIAFAFGVLTVQGFSALPDGRCFWFLPPVALIAWCVPRMRLVLLFALGVLWGAWRAELILRDALPAELEGKSLTVEGRVIGLPEQAGERLRFQFQTESIALGARQWPGCGRIRLDWRGARLDAIATGERWRLQVRLKRPHGLSNPGGFDYERWLYQHRLRATGQVLTAAANLRLQAAGYGIDVVRADLRNRLDVAIGDHPLAGVVTALAIGAREGISNDQWRVFFRTNTGHLIAISGLHIGLTAAFGFFIGRWLWSLPAFTVLWIAAPRVGALCGVVAAGVYCALAGFEVPAQRTLIMISVVMLALWRSRRVQPLDTLLIAMLLVLIADPLAVLAAGFWLSFVAVGILLYSTVRVTSARASWRVAGRAHLAMAIGLAPLLACLFGQNPLLGPLANVVAVPWVSFVVVPLVLAGTLLLPLFPFPGFWLLRGALHALDLLWMLLEKLAGFEWATLTLGVPGWLPIACAGIGAAILLMPRGMPGRALGIVWMGPLFLHASPRPAHGDLWFTVLDVGQGLAAVIQSSAHVLVFDTGPAYSARFDTGAAVVVPYLRHAGIEAVDRLIVSHGDNDHVGGVASLLEQIPVGDVLSSVPEKIGRAPVAACAAEQTWEWDGVRFSMLSPPPASTSSENNASCVLQVQARGGTVLLTGDIEADAEQRLLVAHAARLRADIVLAPHHGSSTSSTPRFVEAVSPRYVVYPVGYRNRWRFPRVDVQQRYLDAGAVALRTDRDGAVTFQITDSVRLTETHRDAYRRYWHEQ